MYNDHCVTTYRGEHKQYQDQINHMGLLGQKSAVAPTGFLYSVDIDICLFVCFIIGYRHVYLYECVYVYSKCKA